MCPSHPLADASESGHAMSIDFDMTFGFDSSEGSSEGAARGGRGTGRGARGGGRGGRGGGTALPSLNENSGSCHVHVGGWTDP